MYLTPNLSSSSIQIVTPGRVLKHCDRICLAHRIRIYFALHADDFYTTSRNMGNSRKEET
ncbi:hypothetical protein VAE055_120004 [Vibrio aestuarianus]|nr:hypothetical protein VAE055_120004 [Vibrio aestuarianus]CAH8182370.1 hypothetical protein VAE115_250003 [Vibrio aestuarianus]CAH8186161.1 hypothetical protein VAE142_690004 [Vibrio aestuarianus]